MKKEIGSKSKFDSEPNRTLSNHYPSDPSPLGTKTNGSQNRTEPSDLAPSKEQLPCRAPRANSCSAARWRPLPAARTPGSRLPLLTRRRETGVASSGMQWNVREEEVWEEAVTMAGLRSNKETMHPPVRCSQSALTQLVRRHQSDQGPVGHLPRLSVWPNHAI